MVAAGRRKLSPTYYEENFQTLLETVVARYGDLLLEAETSFVADFRELDRPARCLWVRLISRKGPLFRADSLAYPEVPETVGAVASLERAAFLDRAPDVGTDELLALLPRARLSAVARRLDLDVGGCRLREEVLERLCDCQDPRLEPVLRSEARPVRPLRTDHVDAFRLLFFGNLRQDWTELVLSQLDVWSYEPYPLDRSTRPFETRTAIDDSLQAYALHARARRFVDGEDLDGAHRLALAALTRTPAWHSTARRTLERMALGVAQALERAGRQSAALSLYDHCREPPSRERRARLLDRLGRSYDALALCREIEGAPRDESERLFAPRFAHRLRRRRGSVPPLHRRRRRRRLLRLPRDPARGIEEQAIAGLGREGLVAYHTENWLWRSLFGLVLWDLVFAPVPGAFHHPFQAGPADLLEPSFRSRREPAVTKRLEEVRAGEWPAERLLERWRAKRGTRNRLVDWSPAAGDVLALAADRISGEILARVLERLSTDVRRYRTGLPDLLAWRQGVAGFQLLEVKGPGDQLRPEQRSWLDFFEEAGVDARILAVEWA